MPRRLEFFFDYVSPFSYLANSQVEAIAGRTGAELVYRPFLLGGVMQATGNPPPATPGEPANLADPAAATAIRSRSFVEGEIFFGNDRLDFVEEALRA